MLHITNYLSRISRFLIMLMFVTQTIIVPSYVYADTVESKMDVAVIEFSQKGNVNITGVGRNCAEQMTTYLAQTGKFNLKERVSLSEVSKEQQLENYTGAFDDKAIAAQVKKLRGVEAIVVGNVTLAADGKNVSIDVRLVNTSTGDILKTEGITCPSDLKVVRWATAQLAYKLAELPVPTEVTSEYNDAVSSVSSKKSTLIWVLLGAAVVIGIIAGSSSNTSVTTTVNN